MEAIYEFIKADSSQSAAAWFAKLSEAVYSVEQYPSRGTVIPENKKLRRLLFGGKPNIFRIIYPVDRRNAAVNALHICHGARTPLATK
jgi:plasmid stabilization system protein ParE